MEKLMERISGFVEPLAEWVHKMKFLNALAEAMQVLLPITVIGSFACLFAFIDLGPWQAFLAANPMILTAFMNAQSWTLSSIAFYVVLVLPYLYAKRLEMKEPLSCVPLAIAAFLLLTPTQLYTAIDVYKRQAFKSPLVWISIMKEMSAWQPRILLNICLM